MAVAEIERKYESRIEAMQQNFIREALQAAKQKAKSSIMGDDIRLAETHIDGSDVNPVNLLYFFAEEQFFASLEALEFVRIVVLVT